MSLSRVCAERARELPKLREERCVCLLSRQRERRAELRALFARLFSGVNLRPCLLLRENLVDEVASLLQTREVARREDASRLASERRSALLASEEPDPELDRRDRELPAGIGRDDDDRIRRARLERARIPKRHAEELVEVVPHDLPLLANLCHRADDVDAPDPDGYARADGDRPDDRRGELPLRRFRRGRGRARREREEEPEATLRASEERSREALRSRALRVRIRRARREETRGRVDRVRLELVAGGDPASDLDDRRVRRRSVLVDHAERLVDDRPDRVRRRTGRGLRRESDRLRELLRERERLRERIRDALVELLASGLCRLA
jgi:hypothetical protein